MTDFDKRNNMEEYHQKLLNLQREFKVSEEQRKQFEDKFNDILRQSHLEKTTKLQEKYSRHSTLTGSNINHTHDKHKHLIHALRKLDDQTTSTLWGRTDPIKALNMQLDQYLERARQVYGDLDGPNYREKSGSCPFLAPTKCSNCVGLRASQNIGGLHDNSLSTIRSFFMGEPEICYPISTPCLYCEEYKHKSLDYIPPYKSSPSLISHKHSHPYLNAYQPTFGENHSEDHKNRYIPHMDRCLLVSPQRSPSPVPSFKSLKSHTMSMYSLPISKSFDDLSERSFRTNRSHVNYGSSNPVPKCPSCELKSNEGDGSKSFDELSEIIKKKLDEEVNLKEKFDQIFNDIFKESTERPMKLKDDQLNSATSFNHNLVFHSARKNEANPNKHQIEEQFINVPSPKFNKVTMNYPNKTYRNVSNHLPGSADYYTHNKHSSPATYDRTYETYTPVNAPIYEPIRSTYEPLPHYSHSYIRPTTPPTKQKRINFSLPHPHERYSSPRSGNISDGKSKGILKSTTYRPDYTVTAPRSPRSPRDRDYTNYPSTLDRLKDFLRYKPKISPKQQVYDVNYNFISSINECPNINDYRYNSNYNNTVPTTEKYPDYLHSDPIAHYNVYHDNNKKTLGEISPITSVIPTIELPKSDSRTQKETIVTSEITKPIIPAKQFFRSEDKNPREQEKSFDENIKESTDKSQFEFAGPTQSIEAVVDGGKNSRYEFKNPKVNLTTVGNTENNILQPHNEASPTNTNNYKSDETIVVKPADNLRKQESNQIQNLQDFDRSSKSDQIQEYKTIDDFNKTNDRGPASNEINNLPSTTSPGENLPQSNQSSNVDQNLNSNDTSNVHNENPYQLAQNEQEPIEKQQLESFDEPVKQNDEQYESTKGTPQDEPLTNLNQPEMYDDPSAEISRPGEQIEQQQYGNVQYQEQAYQNLPHQEQPYQEQQYQEPLYQEQSYQEQPYQEQPYQEQPYQEQPYQEQPQQQQLYQESPYQNEQQFQYQQEQPQQYQESPSNYGPGFQSEQPYADNQLYQNEQPYQTNQQPYETDPQFQGDQPYSEYPTDQNFSASHSPNNQPNEYSQNLQPEDINNQTISNEIQGEKSNQLNIELDNQNETNPTVPDDQNDKTEIKESEPTSLTDTKLESNVNSEVNSDNEQNNKLKKMGSKSSITSSVTSLDKKDSGKVTSPKSKVAAPVNPKLKKVVKKVQEQTVGAKNVAAKPTRLK